MATRETSNGTRTIERWTNEGTAGYYSGNPLVKTRDLTAAEVAELAAQDTARTQGATATTIEDYLVTRRARLTAIRTQAQTVAGRTASAAGTLATAQLSTAVRALEVDMKTLANAIDDLAQFDIRHSRRTLALYDGTD